mmetsp:Transcript_14939/g.43927  ORF Transcript_14939/g.43927 Transcript_14939/m.43927 type:complete len:299 (+) Transcript_14939:1036-1932(+)
MLAAVTRLSHKPKRPGRVRWRRQGVLAAWHTRRRQRQPAGAGLPHLPERVGQRRRRRLCHAQHVLTDGNHLWRRCQRHSVPRQPRQLERGVRHHRAGWPARSGRAACELERCRLASRTDPPGEQHKRRAGVSSCQAQRQRPLRLAQRPRQPRWRWRRRQWRADADVELQRQQPVQRWSVTPDQHVGLGHVSRGRRCGSVRSDAGRRRCLFLHLCVPVSGSQSERGAQAGDGGRDGAARAVPTRDGGRLRRRGAERRRRARDGAHGGAWRAGHRQGRRTRGHARRAGHVGERRGAVGRS